MEKDGIAAYDYGGKKVNAVAFCCPGLCDSTCQVNLVGVVVTVCDDLPHFVIVCKQHATGRCGIPPEHL